jgi:hypothetical protein
LRTFLEYALSRQGTPLCHLVEWIRTRESGATLTDPDEFLEHIEHRAVTPRAKQILMEGIKAYEREVTNGQD